MSHASFILVKTGTGILGMVDLLNVGVSEIVTLTVLVIPDSSLDKILYEQMRGIKRFQIGIPSAQLWKHFR